jgi:hypothetical protein
LTRLQRTLRLAAGLAILGYGAYVMLVAPAKMTSSEETRFRPTFALAHAAGQLQNIGKFAGPATLTNIAAVFEDLGADAADRHGVACSDAPSPDRA